MHGGPPLKIELVNRATKERPNRMKRDSHHSNNSSQGEIDETVLGECLKTTPEKKLLKSQ
jgi:hypothetical protein